jgi:hypothetical protein
MKSIIFIMVLNAKGNIVAKYEPACIQDESYLLNKAKQHALSINGAIITIR